MKAHLGKIGLCAHFCEQGEWAFEYAYGLAKSYGLQLNIFHWLDSPFPSRKEIAYKDSTHSEIVPVTEEFLVQREKELRMHYDVQLGEYDRVGFRLCTSSEETDLARCLSNGDYDLLVIGYKEPGMEFGAGTVERFASMFEVPVVLVGPTRSEQFHCNPPAMKLLDALQIPPDKCASLS